MDQFKLPYNRPSHHGYLAFSQAVIRRQHSRPATAGKRSITEDANVLLQFPDAPPSDNAPGVPKVILTTAITTSIGINRDENNGHSVTEAWGQTSLWRPRYGEVSIVLFLGRGLAKLITLSICALYLFPLVSHPISDILSLYTLFLKE